MSRIELALSMGVAAVAAATGLVACTLSRAETLPESTAVSATAAPSAAPSASAPAASAAPRAGGEALLTTDAGSDAGLDAAVDADADAGLDGGEAPIAACPPEMVEVGRTCVDRYEAHLVHVAADGVVTALAPYLHPDSSTHIEARSEPDVFPQAYISRNESTVACKNAGKRLCSRAEWTLACTGPRRFHYPYGAKAKAGVCNSGKAHLLTKFFGADARGWKYEESFNNPKLDQEPGFLAKAGEHTGCEARGVFDMVGNLHEWVSDTVDEDIEEVLERDQVTRRTQPHRPGNGIFMGGFFSTTDEHGPGCTFVTIAHEPSYHDYSTGFRCCKDSAHKPTKPAKKKPRK